MLKQSWTPRSAFLPLSPQKLLFERGKESLESEFRSLMTRHSKVVSPVLILDLISGEDELEVQEEVPLEHLPEGVLLDVIRISRWLVEYGHNQGGCGPAGIGGGSFYFFNSPGFVSFFKKKLNRKQHSNKSTVYVPTCESSQILAFLYIISFVFGLIIKD